MKKDKAWLKVEARKHFDEWWSSSMSLGKLTDGTLELIDQLDEPEITEAQAWETLAPRFSMSATELQRQVLDGFLAMTAEEIELESNKIKKLADGIKKLHAENEELKAKLDEPEKVVVPQFVAEYTQEGKELGCDLGTAMTVQTEMLKDIRDYIKNNEELFARAWLDGYEIEKEPLYYVTNGANELMLIKRHGVISAVLISFEFAVHTGHLELHQLTESEIKDYDERYVPFMEPAEVSQ